jgi:hypothetical protein
LRSTAVLDRGSDVVQEAILESRTIAMLGLLVCLTGAVTVGAHREFVASDGLREQAPRTTVDLEREAFERAGLEAAAKITGSYVHTLIWASDGDPATLRELASLSQVIVIGSATSAICRVAAGGRGIVTDFQVSVDSVLKGDRAISGMTISVPGGKAVFADGSTSEVRTPGFLRPQIGSRLVWFVRRESAGEQARFVPVHGPLGIYDLEAPTRTFVIPAGNFKSPLGERLLKRRLSAEEFVAEVTQAIK